MTVFDPMTAIIEAGKMAINRIWPDPIKQAEEQRKLLELQQSGDLEALKLHVQTLLGQIEVNKMEAQHKRVFIAGWRPWIGWVGGMALAYQFVVYPFLLWIWVTLQAMGKLPAIIQPPPVLETGALFSLVTGLLGISASRSWDKKNGVSTESIKLR